MQPGGKVRIDKWLYAMRLFKTRSQAAEFCARERVSVNGNVAKASRMVAEGNTITLSHTGFKLVYEVIRLTEKRLSAKLVPDFCKNVTSREELDKIEFLRAQRNFLRERGTGRPTKRERRDLDDFFEW
jgi:ribosome-associated heat shock protein Hsp15